MAENVPTVLSAQQLKTIQALLVQPSDSAAATSAGISRRTLLRWQQDPVFVAALEDAQRDAIRTLARGLAGLGSDALTALKDALGKETKIAVRVRAAEVITDRVLRYAQALDLEERLAALEARLEGTR